MDEDVTGIADGYELLGTVSATTTTTNHTFEIETFNDNKISRVVYLEKPDGTYYPLSMFPAEEARLSDFKWLEQWRPLRWEDVFVWK